MGLICTLAGIGYAPFHFAVGKALVVGIRGKGIGDRFILVAGARANRTNTGKGIRRTTRFLSSTATMSTVGATAQNIFRHRTATLGHGALVNDNL